MKTFKDIINDESNCSISERTISFSKINFYNITTSKQIFSRVPLNYVLFLYWVKFLLKRGKNSFKHNENNPKSGFAEYLLFGWYQNFVYYKINQGVQIKEIRNQIQVYLFFQCLSVYCTETSGFF